MYERDRSYAARGNSERDGRRAGDESGERGGIGMTGRMKENREEPSGKVVLITGASSGFGRMASVALAKDGWRVAASMRDLAKAKPLLEEAERERVGRLVSVFRLDVTDPDSVGGAVGQIIGRYGRIDVLINNAGYAAGGFLEETDVEVWKRQFETNVFGLLRVTKAVIPHMRARGEGKIINIGSISGRIGYPALGPYASSKFALEGLSESLRLELLPFGIHVVLLEPGSYKTEIWSKGMASFVANPDSPYYDLAQNVLREVKQTAEQAGDPREVVDLLRRVVNEKSPDLRYPVGKGVKAFLMLKSALPWKWLERAAVKRYAKKPST